MPQQEIEPTSLDYAGRETRPTGPRFRSDQLGCLLAVVGLPIMLLLAAWEPIGAIVAVVLVLAMLGFWALRVMLKPKPLDEEFDAEYESRQAIRKRLLAGAKRAFAGGPIGAWHASATTLHGYRSMRVYEERAIVCVADGTGRYHWRGEDRPNVTSTFVWKVEGGTLFVRMVFPAAPETWTEVDWGFDTVKEADDEWRLLVWFEAKSTLPPDLADHWPFAGEYIQATGMLAERLLERE